jgi:hypothetical protein
VLPSLALSGSCAGRPVSTPSHCVAHSCTTSTSRPSKEDGGTLERGTDAYPTPALDNAVTSAQWSASPPSPPVLCGHPRRCATISGTTAPSPVLWEGRRDIATPAAVHPTALRQLRPRVSVRTVTEREAPTLLPSKPFLDGYRTRHDARRDQDSSGRPSTPRHYASCRHM